MLGNVIFSKQKTNTFVYESIDAQVIGKMGEQKDPFEFNISNISSAIFTLTKNERPSIRYIVFTASLGFMRLGFLAHGM